LSDSLSCWFSWNSQKFAQSLFTLAAVTGCLMGLFPLKMQQASIEHFIPLVCKDICVGGSLPDLL